MMLARNGDRRGRSVSRSLSTGTKGAVAVERSATGPAVRPRDAYPPTAARTAAGSVSPERPARRSAGRPDPGRGRDLGHPGRARSRGRARVSGRCPTSRRRQRHPSTHRRVVVARGASKQRRRPRSPAKGTTAPPRYTHRHNHGSPVSRAERKRPTLRPSNLIWVMPAQGGAIMGFPRPHPRPLRQDGPFRAGAGASSTSWSPASSGSHPDSSSCSGTSHTSGRASFSHRCCRASRGWSTGPGCSPECSARSSSASPVRPSTRNSSLPRCRR